MYIEARSRANLMKTVVQIGIIDEESATGVRPLGSGVVINWKNDSFVVTVKHVVNQVKLPLVFTNPSRKNPLKTLFQKQLDPWIYHSNEKVDLAVAKLDHNEIADVYALDENRFQQFDTTWLGIEVFYLGFPFNLTPSEKLVPVFRKGCIAQRFPNKVTIQAGNRPITFTEKMMILDAHVSKGNSGCPVFAYPEKRAGNISSPALFLGIIQGHIESPIKATYNHMEHSGLGIMYSCDIVKELLNQIN